jgi:hypothetical protein
LTNFWSQGILGVKDGLNYEEINDKEATSMLEFMDRLLHISLESLLTMSYFYFVTILALIKVCIYPSFDQS